MYGHSSLSVSLYAYSEIFRVCKTYANSEVFGLSELIDYIN